MSLSNLLHVKLKTSKESDLTAAYRIPLHNR